MKDHKRFMRMVLKKTFFVFVLAWAVWMMPPQYVLASDSHQTGGSLRQLGLPAHPNANHPFVITPESLTALDSRTLQAISHEINALTAPMMEGGTPEAFRLISGLNSMISDPKLNPIKRLAAGVVLGSAMKPSEFQSAIDHLRVEQTASESGARAVESLAILSKSLQTDRLTGAAFEHAADQLHIVFDQSRMESSASPIVIASGLEGEELKEIYKRTLGRWNRGFLRKQDLPVAFANLSGYFNLTPSKKHQSGRTLAARLLTNFGEDLLYMAGAVPVELEKYVTIFADGAASLNVWGKHVDMGQAQPSVKLRINHDDPKYDVSERPIRLVLYPVGSDPLQLGHWLIGLEASAVLSADRTVFMGQGDDEAKPHMTKAAIRHPILEASLKRAAPLFAHSRLGVGNTFYGEKNLFRLFALNPDQPIIATYVAGDDHYKERKANGGPDTLPMLEENMADLSLGHNPEIHQVQAAFIRRTPGPLAVVPTTIPVHFLSWVGFEVSSTDIRTKREYWLMHPVFYRLAKEAGLYGISQAVEEIP